MSYPVLYRGQTINATSSKYTAMVQRALGLTVDGIYGPNTEQAVKSFQSRKGLKVDGRVGSQTWSALLGGETPTQSPTLPTLPGTSPGVPTNLIDKVLGVFILYGLFKVLQKAL